MKINECQYDRLFDDLIVIPSNKEVNTYILKNKPYETDSVLVGKIKWKEDNFYLSLSKYVSLEAEYLKGIAEYMEGLEWNDESNDNPEEEKTSGKEELNSIISTLFGGIEGFPADLFPNSEEGESTNEENN